MHDAKKWHQTIHHHTIEFSKNTHPPATHPHKGALTSRLQFRPARHPVSGATLPAYQTPTASGKSSFSRTPGPATPQQPRDTKAPRRKPTGTFSDKPGLHSPPSDPLRPSGAAPWLADLKKVTQQLCQGQIAWWRYRSATVCAAHSVVAGDGSDAAEGNPARNCHVTCAA